MKLIWTAADEAPADPATRGSQTLSTKISFGFFRTGFRSSDRRQYSESLVRYTEVTSMTIIGLTSIIDSLGAGAGAGRRRGGGGGGACIIYTTSHLTHTRIQWITSLNSVSSLWALRNGNLLTS